MVPKSRKPGSLYFFSLLSVRKETTIHYTLYSVHYTGEYLTVASSGDLMVYTDSDSVPGFGFLKLSRGSYSS